MTVTPVLADQLEDAGRRASACGDFLVEWRIGAAEADLPEVPAECRPACEAELARYRRALELLDAAGGDPLRPSSEPAAEGRVALAASSATHAVLPLLATRAGLRLQLDAGIRSHRRRFGWDGGFWLPECAYAPGLEWRLAEHGRALVLRRPERPRGAAARRWRRCATEAGPVALPIDWEAIGWLWSLDGYPSDPAHAQFAGKSLRGIRIWKVGGGAYDPAAAAAAARRQAGEFLAAVAGAPARASPPTRGRRGLLVFAIDTELLGHWWSEGPIWLRGGARGRRGRGGAAASPCPQALAEHEPVERAAGGLDLGRGQGPAHLGLAAGRRPRLGRAAARAAAAAGARGRACAGDAALRAAPRAARGPGERLGLPRPARPGGRLRLPARHRPRRGDAGGHRLAALPPTRACARSPRT